MSAGAIRVTFECDNGAGLIGWAKQFLEEEGYVVAKPRPLHAAETPTQFCKRLGIHPGTFSRKVRLAECPQNFDAHRTTKTSRVLWLRASVELEDFMKTNVGEIREKKDATKK